MCQPKPLEEAILLGSQLYHIWNKKIAGLMPDQVRSKRQLSVGRADDGAEYVIP